MNDLWSQPFTGLVITPDADMQSAYGISQERYDELRKVFDSVQKKMVADFYKEVKIKVKVDEEVSKAIEQGSVGGAVLIEGGSLEFKQSKYLNLLFSSPEIKTLREFAFCSIIIGKMLEDFGSRQSRQILEGYVEETCNRVFAEHGKEAETTFF